MRYNIYICTILVSSPKGALKPFVPGPARPMEPPDRTRLNPGASPGGRDMECMDMMPPVGVGPRAVLNLPRPPPWMAPT